MGNLFSGGSNNNNRISPHDRAVLDLKVQRDKLKDYKKKINGIIGRETEIAKEHLRAGQKQKALICLKKKKYQENLLDKAEAQLNNVEEMINQIEFAQIEQKVLAGLKQGTEVLKELNNMMKIEDVEKLMEDTEDAIAYQKEIGELLSGKLSSEDDEEIERELEMIIREQTGEVLEEAPEVPTTPLKTVPTEPKATSAEAARKKQKQELVAA